MTNNIIVTTTINEPTEAIKAYDNMPGWHLIVTGDVKTPEDFELENGTFISDEEQRKKWPELYFLIGPNCIQRGRLMAYLAAAEQGAEMVATVDDDNIPMPWWDTNNIGLAYSNVYITHNTRLTAFDIMSIRGKRSKHVWHRGFPPKQKKPMMECCVNTMNHRFMDNCICLQQNLWSGTPDVDALCKYNAQIYHKSIDNYFKGDAELYENNMTYYAHDLFLPINTQNTFIKASHLIDFPAWPFIGRNDDIWGGYWFQAMHGFGSAVYGPVTVRHDRHETDLLEDMKAEMYGYRNTELFLQHLKDKRYGKALELLPPDSVEAIICWANLLKDIQGNNCYLKDVKKRYEDYLAS